jgi:hypothetical protein
MEHKRDEEPIAIHEYEMHYILSYLDEHREGCTFQDFVESSNNRHATRSGLWMLIARGLIHLDYESQLCTLPKSNRPFKVPHKLEGVSYTLFSIRIPKALDRQIRKTAKKLKTSRNAIVVAALEDYLERMNVL